jgi:uncharacterized membrane protein YebE (DUF533 family)
MNLSNILNQFMGSSAAPSEPGSSGGLGQTVSNLASNIPGGLVGGAAAGGAMALLMGNKSARKIAGKAATYGGAALLGGLAFKAYRNWQGNNAGTTTPTPQQPAVDPSSFHQRAISQQHNSGINPELALIKAMVAAAKADGHVDADEQQKIFEAVEKTSLSASEKGLIFEFLKKDIPIFELTTGINCIEMKAEIYLASCLVITHDHPAERTHLDNLAMALQLPEGLSVQLEQQANQAFAEST